MVGERWCAVVNRGWTKYRASFLLRLLVSLVNTVGEGQRFSNTSPSTRIRGATTTAGLCSVILFKTIDDLHIHMWCGQLFSGPRQSLRLPGHFGIVAVNELADRAAKHALCMTRRPGSLSNYGQPFIGLAPPMNLSIYLPLSTYSYRHRAFHFAV